MAVEFDHRVRSTSNLHVLLLLKNATSLVCRDRSLIMAREGEEDFFFFYVFFFFFFFLGGGCEIFFL